MLLADSRGFHLQALAAPCQIQLQVHIILVAIGLRRGADLLVAAPEPAVQRADLLPFQAVGREAIGLALAQQIVQPLHAFTLVENVVLAAGSAKTGNPITALFSSAKEAERAAALELLERTGIAEAAERHPGELPLGFLKRLEVSRALALKPDLLLLDEPLAGLNQAEAESLADLIAKLAAEGQAIMLIEHNIREVTRICPTLYVQDNGRALAHGPTDEVMADQAVRRAYLGLEEAC